MKTVALVSLGCAKNLVDSEVLLGYLEKAGYNFRDSLDDAGTIIVNTCGFISPARKEAEEMIQRAVKAKKKGKQAKVVVTGCYVERNKNNLKQKYPEVDIWTGVRDLDKIISIIEGKAYESQNRTFLYSHETPRHISTPAAWAYVKISEGCSHRCSFCSIPLIKGPYGSRPISSIAREAELLVSRGVKEINLISQDSTFFGCDQGLEDGLFLLLKELLKIRDLDWLRILYGYPEEVSDSLLEIMQEKRICPYLDIPFQHSDPQVIRKMKRGLDGIQALKLIQKLRNKIPDIAIRTSLVVGFPGEGSKEFENLLRFVQEACFDHLGVFTYSREEGTESFDLGDPVEERVKKNRLQKIMEVQAEISCQNNRKYLNGTLDVLIDGYLQQDPSVLAGRTRYQAPEVDGLVFIEREKNGPEAINSIQKVEITASDRHDLYGKLKK